MAVKEWRLFRLAAVVLAIGLVAGLCGCSSESDDDDSSPTDQPSPTATTSTPAVEITPTLPPITGTPFVDEPTPTSVPGTETPLSGDDDTAETPTAPPGQLEFSSIKIDPNPRSTLSALVKAETNIPAQVFVQYGLDQSYSSVTGISSLDTSHVITVVNMKHSSEYHMRAVAMTGDGQLVTSDDDVFATGSLPGGIPDFLITVDQAALVQPGVTLFGFAFCEDEPDVVRPAYVGVDRSGEVVWYYDDPDFSPCFAGRDVKQLQDGNFLIQTNSGFRVITIGGETVVDINAADVWLEAFHHDTIQLPDGRFLALATEYREEAVPWSDQPEMVKGDQIVELDRDGQIYWVWSTFDHLDTSRYPIDPSAMDDSGDDIDWTHSNALVYLKDEDAILLSMRNQEWIIKIDHATGDILWRLGNEGDFELVNYDAGLKQTWFSTQHAPEPHQGGNIFIYDNGAMRQEYSTDSGESGGESEDPDAQRYSRGVLYKVDANKHQVTQTWQFVTDYFTNVLGDADKLENGNVLLCAGGVKDPADPAQIIEVTGDDPSSRVWLLELYGFHIYRSTRLESFWLETPDVKSLGLDQARAKNP